MTIEDVRIGVRRSPSGRRRSPGPTTQEIIANDRIPPPPAWLEETDPYLGEEDIPVEEYISQEWHELEVERVWRRTWQVACRLEDIPDVGDYIVYDIVNDSILVVRVAPDDVRAYYNACLHRGTALCDDQGHKDYFRCPFHGFTWSLEGELEFIPAKWDFEHVDQSQLSLPQVQVGTWGGFVFINQDPNCVPLAEYLEILPEHLAFLDLENRYKAVHVIQIVPCNWKVALEAFSEGYHIPETHVEHIDGVRILPPIIQYDAWDQHRHIDRLILPTGPGQSSEVGYLTAATEQQLFDQSAQMAGVPTRELEAGETARLAMAELNRAMFSQTFGKDMSGISDTDAVDMVQYNVFPNFTVWGTTFAPLCYRFRPNGNTPHECIMEVWYLYPQPDTGERRRSEPVHVLERGEAWTTIPELGYLAPVFDQDMVNLPRIQKGLRTMRKPGVTLAGYQEIRIRHHHKTLGEYIANDPTVPT